MKKTEKKEQDTRAPETQAKKKRPFWKALWISLCAVLAAAVVTGCIYAGSIGSIWAGDVPIVDKPTVEPTDAPEPSIVPLGTELPDISEDDDEDEDDSDILESPTPISSATLAALLAAATPAPTPTEVPIYKQVPIDANTINILLVGIDARPDEKSGRSDTMLLLSYNRKLKSAALISFMRDTWVPIAGHGWNRLNACYSIGGIGLLVNTINKQFKLDIQNYIIIRFESMMGVIDEIGGINVYLTKDEANFYNKKNPHDAKISPKHEGVNTLNGDYTLQHSRNRYVGHGDFDRTRRQRDIVLAIFKKLKAMNDPAKLSKLLQFSIQNVKTNVSPELLFSLAMESLQTKNLKFIDGRVPQDGTWQYASIGGKSVLSVNIKKNAAYLAKVLSWK